MIKGKIEVERVYFLDITQGKNVERWLTATGVAAMGRQCQPTGLKKLVDRSEVSNEIWRGDAFGK